MNVKMPLPDRIIIDQIDPERLVPGGTDTCIHDLVKYSNRESIAIVGITASRARRLGVWTEITFGTKKVPFMPVARIDRRKGGFLRVPHSVQVAIGLLAFRAQLPRVTLQAHRIETGAVVTLLRRSRFVQFIHNNSLGLTGKSSDSTWRYLPWLYRILERVSLGRADAVVLFNKTDSVRVQTIASHTIVAQTWFDPDVFRLVKTQNSPDDPLHVCFIGRLEAQKDPMLAIQTFAEVCRIKNDAQFLVIGSGSFETRMREFAAAENIADRVSFIGAVDRPRVAALMASSSVMLMTSHYEGSPRVLAEAGAVGLPVVATDEADTDRALDNTTNGIRVAGRSALALASAVVEAAGYSPSDCAAKAEHRAAPNAVAALLSV